MRLSEIAERIGARLIGDDVEVRAVSTLEDAQPGELTFLSNPRYTPKLGCTQASAVILSDSFGPVDLPSLRVGDPYLGFAKALAILSPPPPAHQGIHPTACVHPSTVLGRDVSVGAHVFIDSDCSVGDEVVIHANCTLYRGVRIGNQSVIHSNCSIRELSEIGRRVTLQNGVVIGGDGFGFAKEEDGRWFKVPQSGKVVIADDVEIGANSTIDRPAIGVTRIGRGSKIDNLVQVGHSTSIGEDSLICAQVGIAGSTHIGDRVMLAGQVGVAGHLSIGDDAVATAQSGIPNAVSAGMKVSGYPAIENRRWLRASAAFTHLPEMVKKLADFTKRVQELEKLHLK